jgi:DNA mismatch endonuclease (patch repair protein)
MVHALGFRYRLHGEKLPGRPDLVFASRHKVIFVHGCYWHMHACAYGRVTPKTNADFWLKKRGSNVERDRRNVRELARLGWRVLVVWECSLRRPQNVQRRVVKFLER